MTFNTADYPFTANLLLADGSSSNMVTQNSFGTADFVGILVADPLTLQSFPLTSNNTINHNSVHSSGPTGTEIKAGQAPDFIGGIVLLNSTSSNLVEGNQLWSNTGTDLKWAQETLDPSSPIGVRSYPNTAVCNVPPFGSPFNDNVWLSNFFRTRDICPGNVPLQN